MSYTEDHWGAASGDSTNPMDPGFSLAYNDLGEDLFSAVDLLTDQTWWDSVHDQPQYDIPLDPSLVQVPTMSDSILGADRSTSALELSLKRPSDTRHEHGQPASVLAAFTGPRLSAISLDRPTCVFAATLGEPGTSASLRGYAWSLGDRAGQILYRLQETGEKHTRGWAEDDRTIIGALQQAVDDTVQFHCLTPSELQELNVELDKNVTAQRILPPIHPLWVSRKNCLELSDIESSFMGANQRIINWPEIRQRNLHLLQTDDRGEELVRDDIRAMTKFSWCLPSSPIKVTIHSSRVEGDDGSRNLRHQGQVFGLVKTSSAASGSDFMAAAEVIRRQGDRVFDLSFANDTEVGRDGRKGRTAASLNEEACKTLVRKCAEKNVHINVQYFSASKDWTSLMMALNNETASRSWPPMIPLWQQRMLAVRQLPEDQRTGFGQVPVYDGGRVHKDMDAAQTYRS